MTDASVVAVGTPQSFRQQVARALEMGPDEVGWVQSATAAEELLINAFQPIDVLVLSPEVKEPDALGLAEFVGRQAPGTAIVLVRDHTWNGLLPAAMRAGIRDVVDMTQGTEELRDAVERAIVWATNLRSVSVTRDGRAAGHARQDPLGLLLQGRDRQDVPDVEPRHRDRRGHRPGHGRRRPRHRHGRRLHVLRPGADRHDPGPDGAGRRRRPRSRSSASASSSREHLWGFGAPPDPAAEAPAGEADRQVPARAPQRVRLGRRRRVGRLLGLGARVLRPVRRDLPGDRPRRRRREAPVEGARHAAHDRAAAGAVPRRAEPRGLQGRPGRLRRGARDEDQRSTR